MLIVKWVKKLGSLKSILINSFWVCSSNDDTITSEEIKNTYKLFHTKDLGTKHLDYNIRLSFKTKFKDELSNFAGTDKFCFNCKASSGVETKETFLHTCYTCPH